MDPMHLVSLFGAFQASLQGRGRGMPVRRLYGLPSFLPTGGSKPGSWDTKLDGRGSYPVSDNVKAEIKRIRRTYRAQNIDLRDDRRFREGL